MKRVFLLIFLFISCICSAGAKDTSYPLDIPPNVKPASQSEIQSSISAINSKKNISNSKKTGIKGFFNKLFYPKQKPRPKFDEDSNGYSGVLPNIDSEFKYKKPKSTTVKDKGDSAENYLPEEFQKSKLDDPLFLDVILNKERPSQYNLDMFRILKFLEIFRPVVEHHDSVQKFNANVNLLDLHSRRIQQLYSDKPEGMSSSYFKLQDLAYKAKVLGNLKFEANYYSKFSPVAGTKYAPENILSEDDKFLIELDKLIFEIQQLSN